MISENRSVVSDSLPHMDYTVMKSASKSPGLGSHPLFQGIFPTQGSNTGLPHSRQIIYRLSHKGSPGILDWVAYPLSDGSSRHRN